MTRASPVTFRSSPWSEHPLVTIGASLMGKGESDGPERHT